MFFFSWDWRCASWWKYFFGQKLGDYQLFMLQHRDGQHYLNATINWALPQLCLKSNNSVIYSFSFCLRRSLTRFSLQMGSTITCGIFFQSNFSYTVKVNQWNHTWGCGCFKACSFCVMNRRKFDGLFIMKLSETPTDRHWCVWPQLRISLKTWRRDKHVGFFFLFVFFFMWPLESKWTCFVCNVRRWWRYQSSL